MSTVDPDRSSNWLVRAATVIGDLSNPFYREERQRDVWNEASAVALQVILWLSLLTATAAVWTVGAGALPYVNALMVIVGVASWIAFLYAWSLGVHVETSRAGGRGWPSSSEWWSCSSPAWRAPAPWDPWATTGAPSPAWSPAASRRWSCSRSWPGTRAGVSGGTRRTERPPSPSGERPGHGVELRALEP